MARRRRDKKEAQEAILRAAEDLLLEEGPQGVRLTKVAARVGISHPGVLHHVGSADALLEALSQRTARRVRKALLGGLEDWQDRESEAESSEALETHLDTWLDGASQALSDPQITRLLAWLLATGRDPFPPSEEQGLRQIADRLHRKHAPRADLREIQHRVLLGTLLLYGDALLGDALRARLGLADGPKERAAFRRWTLSLLRQGTQTLEPKEG